jgi:hypothetical protein
VNLLSLAKGQTTVFYGKFGHSEKLTKLEKIAQIFVCFSEIQNFINPLSLESFLKTKIGFVAGQNLIRETHD